jgi:glycogen debranching enzyme
VYVRPLVGEKRPCRVASSNAGQCLFSGIASEERAARVVHTLMESRFFTGWGIRTIATGQSRYNPMSYHNGSVWPHDNALIALGFARYGHREAAGKVMGGLFDASLFLDLQRLPELFCGFERRRGEGPIQYPLACAPQAWAAASVFMLIQSCLGVQPHAAAHELRFDQPTLPPFIEWMEITNLTVNAHSVDLMLERSPHSVSVILRKRSPGLRVTVTK